MATRKTKWKSFLNDKHIAGKNGIEADVCLVIRKIEIIVSF